MTIEAEQIKKYKENDEEAQKALIDKYKGLIWFVIRHEIKTDYIINPDEEEMYQEGLIALDNAIRSYNPDKGIPLKGLAKVCIRHRLMSYVKTVLNRQVHLRTVSLDSYVSEDEKVMLYDIVASQQEGRTRLQEKLDATLSEKELTVLQMRYAGYSYEEIAHRLKVGRKNVDNMIQKIRKKLRDTREE